MGGQQDSQRDRKREHPLAHRYARDHAVDQVGSALRHAPRPAGRAEPAPLTGEGHQLLVRDAAKIVEGTTIAQPRERHGTAVLQANTFDYWIPEERLGRSEMATQPFSGASIRATGWESGAALTSGVVSPP